jgi:predicted nucleotidyltransferase/DNA-binding XRE family transcriptional regulator
MAQPGVPALVRRLRKRLRLTQERFAQRVGVTYSTVNHWESGKRLPHPYLLRRLLQLEAESEGRHAPATTDDGPPSDLDAPPIHAPAPETIPRGLPPEVRAMVVRVVDLFQPEQVILFGSHARGDARPDSDVDLLIVMRASGSRRETQLNVRRSLRDIPLPKDVVVTTPEDFAWRREVVGTIERAASREGRVLYARS